MVALRALRIRYTTLLKSPYLQYTLLYKESLSSHPHQGLELEQTSEVLPSSLLIPSRNISRCSQAGDG